MALDVDVVSPAADVLEALKARSATLAVAESVTGGLIASMITDVPGASEVLDRALVTYTSAAKIAELGLDRDLIGRHGAASAPVAEAMATGVRHVAGTTYAVATTGVAGPTGGTETVPVGTVYLGLAGPDGTQAEHRRFEGDRWTVNRAAAEAALTLLAESLDQDA